MAESFSIFIVIIVGIGILIAAILVAIFLRAFILALIVFLISAGFIGSGLAMLVGWGGVVGAVGLFLMLPGAFFAWIGVRVVKSGLEEMERDRAKYKH